MITLDLSPHEQSKLETQSQQMGVSIEQYIKNVLFPKQKTIADMVKGKRLESFKGDPVAIQQEMRADTTPAINPMIALAKSLPKPTSYTKNAVELQREWRNEWD